MAAQKSKKNELGEGEPLQLSKTKRTSDAEMDITPLIDIVFLLLIFFLVSSKMDESAAVKLPPARTGMDVAQENAIIVLVKDEGGEIVVMRRDGRPFSADLGQQETEIGEYVEAGLAGTEPFDAPKDTIILKAQGKVKEGEVARVAEAIGRATEISVLHYAVIHEQ